MSQRATRYTEAEASRYILEAALPASNRFVGDLIDSLERTVTAAEEGNGKLRILPQPEPPIKPNERAWIRLVDIGDHSMRCNLVDCHREARLLLESRDQEVLPYCTRCALVEFAQWMAGV